MQIGTPGSAYGPGQVMSRPTLGRAVRPLPRAGDVIGTALQRAAIPAPPPHQPGVLHNELLRRIMAARGMRGGMNVPQPIQGALVPQPGEMIPQPMHPATTVDPAALLARARLAQMMQAGGMS